MPHHTVADDDHGARIGAPVHAFAAPLARIINRYGRVVALSHAAGVSNHGATDGEALSARRWTASRRARRAPGSDDASASIGVLLCRAPTRWCRQRYLEWQPSRPRMRAVERRAYLVEFAATGWASSRRDDNVLDVRHVATSRRGGLLRGAAAPASVHVGCVLVPPVVRRGDRFERTVMFGRFVQELCKRRNVHRHTRPGSRSVISCSSQTLPSGSLNEAYEA